MICRLDAIVKSRLSLVSFHDITQVAKNQRVQNFREKDKGHTSFKRKILLAQQEALDVYSQEEDDLASTKKRQIKNFIHKHVPQVTDKRRLQKKSCVEDDYKENYARSGRFTVLSNSLLKPFSAMQIDDQVRKAKIPSSFKTLLNPILVTALYANNIRSPTSVQALTLKYWLGLTKSYDKPSKNIRASLQGITLPHLMIQAQTGTGKSLGYIMALLQDYLETRNDSPWTMLPKRSTNSSSNVIAPVSIVLVPRRMLGEQLFRWAEQLVPGVTQKVFFKAKQLMVEVDDNNQGILKKGHEDVINCSLMPLFDPPKLYNPGILIGTGESLRVALATGSLRLELLKNVVIDEADYALKDIKSHLTWHQKRMRERHPVPAITFLRELIAATRQTSSNQMPIPPLRFMFLAATMNPRIKYQLEQEGILNSETDARPLVFLQDTFKTSTTSTEKIKCPGHIEHYYRILQEGYPVSVVKEDDPNTGVQVDMKQVTRLVTIVSEIRARHSGRQGFLFVPSTESKQLLLEWLKQRDDKNNKCAHLDQYITKHLSSYDDCTLFIGSENDARGIDIPRAGYVIILGPPSTPTSYLHMAGRVGRVGQDNGSKNHPSVYTILGSMDELNRYSTRMSILGLYPQVLL